MATQPCPCGNYGNPNGACTCTQTQIQRYMSRMGGPLLDRIDISVASFPKDSVGGQDAGQAVVFGRIEAWRNLPIVSLTNQ